jgi:hypothetical protein
MDRLIRLILAHIFVSQKISHSIAPSIETRTSPPFAVSHALKKARNALERGTGIMFSIVSNLSRMTNPLLRGFARSCTPWHAKCRIVAFDKFSSSVQARNPPPSPVIASSSCKGIGAVDGINSEMPRISSGVEGRTCQRWLYGCGTAPNRALTWRFKIGL